MSKPLIPRSDALLVADLRRRVALLERLVLALPISSVTPPTNPRHGQVWVFPVDTNNGSVWQFRYNAQSTTPAYPWEFIGGAPLYNAQATATSTSSLSPVDTGTVGPSIVIPRSGVYRVEVFSRMSNNTAGSGANCAPMAPSYAFDPTHGPRINSVGANGAVSVAAAIRAVLVGGETLKVQYQAIIGGSATFDDKRMVVTPEQVV